METNKTLQVHVLQRHTHHLFQLKLVYDEVLQQITHE